MAINKKIGKHSQTANDFLQPLAPTITSVVDVGTGRGFNNAAVDVYFTMPENSQPATSYTVISEPGNYDGTGSSSPVRVAGMSSDVSRTFKMTASNSYGTSPFSANSSAVTATSVPQTISAPTVSSPSAGTDSVSWTAPATGGKAITNYHWASSDGKSGDTASTSVNVSQEQGTSQTYNVYATNANGNSVTSAESASITTTFSFAPFGAFSFTPFGAFQFVPFGFTPFGAFSFTPFGAFSFVSFGFTPFGAFGFLNFGFSPSQCLHEDTLVSTSNGKIPAKDVKIGDTVYTLDIAEINPEESMSLSSAALTSNGIVEAEINNIETSEKDIVIWFNNDDSAKFSQEQPMFVKRDGQYGILQSGLVDSGDYLIKISEDGSITETLVEEVNTLEGSFTVYSFSSGPQSWFIAGDYLVHTK